MNWWPWLEAGAVYVVITAALAAGVAASYGRELEAGRRPGRGWWVRHLLILPILAIAAAALADLLDLSISAAAFSAAMLALGGYKGLCLLEARWRSRAKLAAGIASGSASGDGSDPACQSATASTTGVSEPRSQSSKKDKHR